MPRFISDIDLTFIHGVTREVTNEVIDTPVILFQIDMDKTQFDQYGEIDDETGYHFRPGVSMHAMINKEAQTTEYSAEGVHRKQTVQFGFHRESLRVVDVYPEFGDIVKFNDAYFEITEIIDNQLIGGQPNMRNQHSIICKSVMVERNKLNIEEGFIE